MINLDQTPHPLIEDHYHIRELIANQEKRSADRTFHRERIKSLEERDNLIKDSKEFIVTDFWCDKCGMDFKAQAIRIIEKDWTVNQSIAFYKTKCFQGHWCIRLITDRHKDKFFIKSKLMVKDRTEHINDMIQPHETGFNLLFDFFH